MPRTDACSKPSDEGHDSASAPRRFLAEVQALRAIAVIAVVIYHLDPAWLPGGFTGVDAFFVVSGFLITGHLLAQLRDTGTIRLRRFWAGRLRRLLPAQLVVIAASALAALVVLPWGELTTTLRQGLASLFYVQNWFLAAGSTDYLNASTPPTAFQHFWSLAIEEQFYLAWPVLLVAGWLAAKRMRSSVAGPLIAVTLITVASLALCLVLAQSGGPEAYFSTLVRAWQLGAGALLAFIPTTVRLSRPLTVALAWAGLGLLAFGFVAIDTGVRYPGPYALAPVLGAGAIILAAARGDFGPRMGFLRSRAALFIGNRSYAIYLTHWPIIVILTGSLAYPRLGVLAGALALTAVTSLALYRWVEKPARFHPRVLSTRGAFVYGAAGLGGLGLVLAGLLALSWHNSNAYSPPPFAVGFDSPYGAPAFEGTPWQAFLGQDSRIYPDPSNAARTDLPLVGLEECQPEATDAVPVRCTFGPESAARTIALVGDSHAAQWLPALKAIAADRGWRLDTYIHLSCAFSAVPRAYSPAAQTACADANAARLALIRADPRIDVVVTSALAGDGFAGTIDDPDVGVRGFAEYWSMLEADGIDVVVVRDNPQLVGATRLTDCVRMNRSDPGRCSLDQGSSQPIDYQLEAAERVPGVDLIDMTPSFCRDDVCPAVVGNVLVYRDNNHVTATYAASLAPALERQLASLCPRVNMVCGTGTAGTINAQQPAQ